MTRLLFTLAAMLLVCSAFAAPAPEPFISGWDRPLDPSRDCKISRSGDSLTIEMPGTDHDYDPIRKRFNAPRLLRDMDSDFNIQFRIRIDCRPSAKSTVKSLPSCVSAGFLLIFPDASSTSCIRLDYGLSQPGIGLNGYAVPPTLPSPRQKNAPAKGIGEGGYAATKHYFCVGQPSHLTLDHGIQKQFHQICDSGWKDWPFPKKMDYAYLRLEQRDTWINLFISPDGEKWTRVSAHSGQPEKFKLGLVAYSTSTEPSKVRFDQLKLTLGKKEARKRGDDKAHAGKP